MNREQVNRSSNENSQRTKDVLSAFVAGAVTASIASLLLAPMSGRRTRRALRREGRRMKRQALHAQERGRDAIERAAEAASETVSDLKERLPLRRR